MSEIRSSLPSILREQITDICRDNPGLPYGLLRQVILTEAPEVERFIKNGPRSHAAAVSFIEETAERFA